MQIRRGPAAVIGQVPGQSGHCREAGRPPGVVTSREPEDLPVESLLRCSGRGHPIPSSLLRAHDGTNGRRILPRPAGQERRRPVSMPSPCVGFCRLDDSSGICVGCARSRQEIACWKDAPSAILEQIWSDLPQRRARLGIGLHRLAWTQHEILAFIRETFRAGNGTWVHGIFGAVGEFCIGLQEMCEIVTRGDRITAQTERGAIRFDVTDQVRALSMTMKVGAVAKEVVVLAVPRGRVSRAANHSLTELGPDRDAIRSHEPDERLFDLGLGTLAAGFCVRTSDPDLTRELEACGGQEWAALLARLGGAIVRVSPSRVILSPIGRVEVFTPIPLPNGQSPDGPHTHFLPIHLAVGREMPPGLELPEALVPCGIFYPAAGPAETDACSGTATVASS